MEAAVQAQISQALAAGCLQAVMSLVLPELTRFVDQQRSLAAHRGVDVPSPLHGRLEKGEAVHADQKTDISAQLRLLRELWRSHLRYHGGDPQLPLVVQRAMLFRNKVSHQSAMSLAQYREAVATFERLAELVGCRALIRREIRALADKMLASPSAPSVPSTPSIPTVDGLSSSDLSLQAAQRPVEELRLVLSGVKTAGEAPDPRGYASESEVEQDGERQEKWEALRLQGNAKFKAGDFQAATDCYTQAMASASHEPVLYSNRATCYLKLKEFELARDDAEDALDLDTDVVKHYRLLSEALMGLDEYEQAREICEEGLTLDGGDKTLLARIKAVDAAIERLDNEKEAEKEKQREKERLQAAEVFKAGQQAAQQSSTTTNAASRNVNALGIADPIKYDDVPLSDVDVQQRDTDEYDLYRLGVHRFTEAGGLWIQAIEVRSSNAGVQAVRKIVEQVMSHLKSAGEAGVAAAWYRMGLLFSGDDYGVPFVQDLDMQVDKFHKAAACKPFVQTPSGQILRHAGVAEAENALGESFRDGNTSVGVHLDRAFRYLLRSAEHDYAVGQLNVAKAFIKGEGTSKDLKAARFWASRAAQHGLSDGQLVLSHMLHEGIGGPKDAARARSLLDASHKKKLKPSPNVRDLTEAEQHIWWITMGRMDDRQADSLLEYLIHDDAGVYRQFGAEDFWFSTKVAHIYRPVNAVVKAEIETRASAGGLTASNYLASERLLAQAQALLEAGSADEGLNALRRADGLWERPRATFPATFLSAALNVARVQYEKNRKNVDAAYALGRWGIVSPEDRVRHWKKCIKGNPSEAAFLYYLGISLWDGGKLDDAHDVLTDALAMQQNPRWMYTLAMSKIMNGPEATYAVNLEYVATNPPDERFVPDAYYSLAAVHIVRKDLEMGLVYYGIAQAAESASVRFPALFPKLADKAPKDVVEAVIQDKGLMETAVLSDVMTGTTLPCDYCQDNVKPAQILTHKLWKCPRRRVVCQDCEKEMIFDELAAHQQAKHAKRSSKKLSKATSKPSTSKRSVPEVGKAGRLPDPKFHFLGSIQDIIPGKNSKPPVLKLLSEAGDKWELRVTASAASAILGATVGDSLVVFWRSSPTVDAIDKRSLRVPLSSSNEQYGRDVVLHVVKIPLQAVAFELKQLRHVHHDEQAAVCSYCSGKPATSRLSVCSACKRVKYCSRDCQSIHWKRIHRVVCPNAELIDQCLSDSVDVSPDRYLAKPLKDDDFFMAKGLDMPENTLDILRDILQTFETDAGREPEFQCEHYMLPPYGGGEIKPGAITGSVRFYRDRRSLGICVQFRVGYLTSTPTPPQQQGLVRFFHLPPHNPLQLKYQDTTVHLERCKVLMDDADGKGFRLGMDVALDKLPTPALAELLDYLITNTSIYLS